MTTFIDILSFLFFNVALPFLFIWLLGNFIDSCQRRKDRV